MIFANWVGGFTPTHIELLKLEIGLLDAVNLNLLKKLKSLLEHNSMELGIV